jgi:hypothetical protein
MTLDDERSRSGYRDRLLEELKRSAACRHRETPGLVRIMVNRSCLWTLDCGRPDPVLTLSSPARPFNVLELRTESGLLIGALDISGEAQSAAFPIGSFLIEVRLEQDGDRVSMKIGCRTAPARAGSVRALAASLSESLRQPAPVPLRGLAIVQIMLLVTFMGLLGERFYERRQAPLPAGGPPAAQPSVAPERRTAQPASASGQDEVLTKQRQELLQLRQTVDRLAHTQTQIRAKLEKVQTQVQMTPDGGTQQKIVKDLMAELRHAAEEREQIRKQLQQLVVASQHQAS